MLTPGTMLNVDARHHLALSGRMLTPGTILLKVSLYRVDYPLDIRIVDIQVRHPARAADHDSLSLFC